MRDFPEFSGPMATWPRVESMPHASEALVAVRRLGWMTALATNAADSDESQIWLALQRAGLAPLLDAVYCSQNVGHRKPSADFFDAILSDLALDPFNVVMVGDDYEVDVVGANACGIRAIWLASELEDAVSATLCRSVTSLAEVPGVLEQWGRERT
jgi:putative hydrolase of the HAD superfamily